MGVFGLYAATLCPTVYWYDSAELTAAAATLGITHPPGYPVYTWIGFVASALPVEPALALNAMSAAFAAAAVALLFAIGRELGVARGPAAVGAATLGVGNVFWMNAVIAEVYCPGVAGAALVVLLLLRAVRFGSIRLMLLGALAAGVSLGLHMSIATLGLGLAWLVWIGARRWQAMLWSGLAALGGSLVFAWIPYRAAQDPPLNACDPSTAGQLAWYLSGGAYRRVFAAEVGVLDRVTTLGDSLAAQLTWVGLGLAVVGMLWLVRARRSIGVAFGLMMLGNLGFFFRYQTHDVEVFLLPTTMLLCALAGCGVHAVIERVSKPRPGVRSRTIASSLVAAAFVLPIGLGIANHAEASKRGFDEAERYLGAVVEALAQDAVILTFATPEEWKRYAVFAMYGQLVRGERTDVRHWVAPDVKRLAQHFDASIPLYAYVPLEILTRSFEVAREGPVFRVVAPKPDAVRTTPRKQRRGRTCETFTQYEVRDDR